MRGGTAWVLARQSAQRAGLSATLILPLTCCSETKTTPFCYQPNIRISGWIGEP
jgi:hypothetical protein